MPVDYTSSRKKNIPASNGIDVVVLIMILILIRAKGIYRAGRGYVCMYKLGSPGSLGDY